MENLNYSSSYKWYILSSLHYRNILDSFYCVFFLSSVLFVYYSVKIVVKLDKMITIGRDHIYHSVSISLHSSPSIIPTNYRWLKTPLHWIWSKQNSRKPDHYLFSDLQVWTFNYFLIQSTNFFLNRICQYFFNSWHYSRKWDSSDSWKSHTIQFRFHCTTHGLWLRFRVSHQTIH